MYVSANKIEHTHRASSPRLQHFLKKRRTWQYMAWATIFFLVSIVTSCVTFLPLPEKIDIGSVRFSARQVLHGL